MRSYFCVFALGLFDLTHLLAGVYYGGYLPDLTLHAMYHGMRAYENLVVAYEERRLLTLALALTRTRCCVSASASAILLEMKSQASLKAPLVT